MFKKYKAAHGGRGPAQDFYSAATGGVGLFGRLGLRQERELTDQLISEMSSREEFRGLEGMLEVGKSPLTKEQHADFRSQMIQTALDRRVFNAGLEEFRTNSQKARGLAVGDDDAIMLDNFEAMANHAERLAAAGHTDKASEVFGSVLQSYGAYAQHNEEQRLELESAQAAGRETIRNEIQSELNSKIFDPIRQDTANYEAIRAQLEGPSGETVAAPSLVSTVLEYAGAQLRQSDDGNWSFAIGPLGLSDTNLPPMTYSQIRNRLDQAFSGRDQYMRGEAARFGVEAKKRGFEINGTGINDLLFPLTNQVYRERERESAPAAPTPEQAGAKFDKVEKTVTNQLEAAGRSLLPNFVEGTSRALSYLFDPNDVPIAGNTASLPVNGDVPRPRPRITGKTHFHVENGYLVPDEESRP